MISDYENQSQRDFSFPGKQPDSALIHCLMMRGVGPVFAQRPGPDTITTDSASHPSGLGSVFCCVIVTKSGRHNLSRYQIQMCSASGEEARVPLEVAQLCECVSVCSAVFACFLITPVFALVCIVFK